MRLIPKAGEGDILIFDHPNGILRRKIQIFQNRRVVFGIFYHPLWAGEGVGCVEWGPGSPDDAAWKI